MNRTSTTLALAVALLAPAFTGAAPIPSATRGPELVDFLIDEVTDYVDMLPDVPAPAGEDGLSLEARRERLRRTVRTELSRGLADLVLARPLDQGTFEHLLAELDEKFLERDAGGLALFEQQVNDFVYWSTSSMITGLQPVLGDAGFATVVGVWQRAGSAEVGGADPRGDLQAMHDEGSPHHRFAVPVGSSFGVPRAEGSAHIEAVLDALDDLDVGALQGIRYMNAQADRFLLDYSDGQFQVPVWSTTLGDEVFGRMRLFLWTHDAGDSPRLRFGRFPAGVVTAIELAPEGELASRVRTEAGVRTWLQDYLARRAGRGPLASSVTATADHGQGEQSLFSGFFGQ